jgi:autophagy-related protein 101
MESTLQATAVKIVTNVNTHRDHIPPITSTDANPFPYTISVNQKEAGWGARLGMY